MRLSDLMKKKDRVSDFATQAPPEATPDKAPDKTEKSPPDSGQLQQQLDKVESSAQPAGPSDHARGAASTELAPQSGATAKGSLYDSLPSAIYRAAEQLEIPISQNEQVTLRNARTSILKILARAVDSADGKKGLWEATRKIANDLSALIALNPNFAQMTRLYNHTHPEERLMNHSINTAVIAIDAARSIDNTEYSPQEIGAAALLHDVGVAALGLDIASDEKNPVFRTHVAKSVEILEQMKVTEAIRTMVAQHHERIDGQGYPAGISGNNFLVSSQILSLTEKFERIMYGFCQDKQSQDAPPQNYMKVTLREFSKAVSPDVLKAFISLRGFYPNDTMVELTNRSICRVIRQNEGLPLRPVVQTVIDSAGNHPEDDRIIDLRANTTLSIIGPICHE